MMYRAASNLFGVKKKTSENLEEVEAAEAQAAPIVVKIIEPQKATPEAAEGSGMCPMASMVSTMCPTNTGLSGPGVLSEDELRLLSEPDENILNGDESEVALDEEVLELARNGFMEMPLFDLGLGGLDDDDDDKHVGAKAEAGVGEDFLRALEADLAAEVFAPPVLGFRRRSGAAPLPVAEVETLMVEADDRSMPCSMKPAMEATADFRRALRGGSSCAADSMNPLPPASECGDIEWQDDEEVKCESGCSTLEQLPPLAGGAGRALMRNTRQPSH